MALSRFTITVGPPSTGPLQEVTDWLGWQLDETLDDGSTFTFSTRGNSVAAQQIDELATDVWLFKDSVLYRRLRVVAVDQSWDASGNDDVAVTAVDYRRLLQRANVRSALSYTATSQGVIAWNLIQHAQAAPGGNLGITLGTSGPAVPRSRAYEIGQNVYESIAEFTKLSNGMTWQIDENLALQVSQPSLYPAIAMPCELGVVARAMSRPSSADRFANAVIVLGDRQSTTPYQVATATIGTDPRGRWERVFSSTSLKTATALQELGDGLIEETISPMSTWSIELEPSRFFTDAPYALGDFITIVQPRSTVYPVGTPAPTVTGQVTAVSVGEDADGNFTVLIGAVEAP